MTAFVNATARSSPAARTSSTRLVRGRVRRDRVEVAELVRAEAQSGTHRRVELPHGPAAERLDRVVERTDALHRPVGDLHCEGPVALVEALRQRTERAVRVGVLLEDPPDDLVCDAAGAACSQRLLPEPA